MIIKKGYTLNNHKKIQIFLLEYEILVLQSDNNVTISIYKGKNILALQTIELLSLKFSLTIKKNILLMRSRRFKT